MDTKLRDWAQANLALALEPKDISALLSGKHGSSIHKIFSLLVKNVASKSHVRQMNQAKQVQSEMQQLEQLINHSSALSSEYFQTIEQLPPAKRSAQATLNSRLQECYLSMLNETLVAKSRQMDSCSEKRGATANEVLESIEKFILTNYALIHEQDHESCENEMSCGKIDKSPSALVTSIEEKVERIKAMLHELKLMAKDVENGNEAISKDELKALLKKLLDHQCRSENNEGNVSGDARCQNTSKLDFLALTNQLMLLEEFCAKYNRERKEGSVRVLCKLAKVRSLVEQ